MSKNKYTVILILLTFICCLLILSACVDYIPPDEIPGIKPNAVMEIEHTKLNFALGMSVDSAEIIANCNCTLTDDTGNSIRITKYHLTSGRVSYTSFDTSTVGSNRQVAVTYKKNSYYITYNVDSYYVDLWWDDINLYKTVVPQVAFTKDMKLACGVNLSDYNYAVDPEVIKSDPDKGLRFAGWQDSEGNVYTGNFVLQPPTVGNERRVDLYAKFLTEAEFRNYDISYDLRNRKVFNGYNGPKVETLDIPESVTFVDLRNLTTGSFTYVNIPSTAEVAPLDSRLSTPNLKGITVDKGNLKYASHNGGLFNAALSICYYIPSGVTSIELPDNLIRIEKYAFACAGVKSVDLPESVTVLAQYCFAYSALESLGGLENGATVMEGAFVGTKFEEGFKIENGALYYVTQKTAEGEKYGLSRVVDKSITTFTVKKGTISIAGDAFNGCTKLQSVNLGDELLHIGESAFANCTSLKEVVLPDSLQTMGGSVFYNCKSLTRAVVPNVAYSTGSTTYDNMLPNITFRGCSSLTSVTLSNETKTLGAQAFYGCAKLTEISLPEKLEKLNSNVFTGCGITFIKLPKTVTTLAAQVFYNSALESIDLSECTELNAFSSYLFAYSNLKSIVIPEQITVIPDHCFYVCKQLTSADISGVVELKDYAFANCETLSQINFGNALKVINTRAFSGCAFTKVVLPDSVETVAGYAFANSKTLTEFTLGAGIKTFGNFTYTAGTVDFATAAPVFYTSKALESIFVSPQNKSFTSVNGVLYGESVCGHNYGAASVLYYVPSSYKSETLTLPSSVKVILPYSIYAQANLKEVLLNEGLENIGKAAFYQSAKLESLSIPASVTNIGASILLECAGVKSFSIAQNNLIYHSDGQLIYRNVGNVLVMYLGFSSDITIAEGTKEIDMGVFMNSAVIKSVIIPDSVEKIGDKVFKGCTNLTTLKIGTGLTQIGAEAFAGLSSLETIEVASGNKAFKVVDGLLYTQNGKKLVLVPARCGMTDFTIAGGVEEIGEWAVSYNATLKNVIIPVGVKIIGNYAFYECRQLAYFEDSEALTTIGSYAFSFATTLNPKDTTETRCCNSLKTVLLHGGITTIGGYAFYGNYGIETLYLKMSVEEATKLVNLGSTNLVYLTLGCPNNSAVGERYNDIVRCIYSEQEPEISYNGYQWWHYVNGEPTIWATAE